MQALNMAMATAMVALTIVNAQAAKWESLFDGKTLKGWTVCCRPVDRDYAYWKVDKGEIIADSLDHPASSYVWLVSEREFGDFTLKLKFKAYRESPGNSGVQYHSRYDNAASWLDGPQIDINPPGPWRTGMIWDETREASGWLFPTVPKGGWVQESQAPKGLKFRYSDEGSGWNDLEITVKGTHVRALLNGGVVTDYDGAGVLDDAIHRKYNVGMKGAIALQIHTGDKLRIRYKEIRIKG